MLEHAVERQIVVLATREPSAVRDATLAVAAGTAPDWQHVVDLAHGHGVSPLLAATLREAPYQSSIPATALRRLESLSAAIALKNGALLAALEQLLATLAVKGVQPLVLKGPALASALYLDPGLRPFTDLDLLCQPHDLAIAGETLRRGGYEPQAYKPAEQDGFHVVYRSRIAMVELHSDLLQLGLPTRCGPTLWKHTETFTVGRTAAFMLDLEHQILHLCIHLHTHGYHRLIWFKDLDLLLRRRGNQVNWVRVRALAEAEGAALSLRHTLALLDTLLETPVPAEARRGLGGDLVGEAAHALLWPRRHVLELRSKQRLRSLRFNPRLGLMGILPSLVVMGRRREKLVRLLGAVAEARRTPGSSEGAWELQPDHDQIATKPEPAQPTLASSHLEGSGGDAQPALPASVPTTLTYHR